MAIVLRRQPLARRIMDEPRALLRTGARRRTVVNRNTLVLRVPWVDGVKTGHTLQAGYVLVGSARRNGVSFVSVVLGTRSEAARDADSLALLSYGVRTFRVTAPLRRGQVLRRPLVKGRDKLRVRVVAARGVRRLIRRGRKVTVRVVVPKQIEGPLPRRSIVGRVVVRSGGKVIGRSQAILAKAIPGPSPAGQAWSWLSKPTTLIGLGGVVVALLMLLRTRRAAERRRRRRPRPETA
jgi:D-alanyl-D-alanine carboxypeptidase (penicillin-binding protein 5/6)